jgi:dTDP-4-amino-4,6-dideoxygalactose transaminase
MTELQASLLIGQLEMLPGFTEKRARAAGRLSDALSKIDGVSPLPAQSTITREAIYCYVFRYCPNGPRASRDLFAAALEAEGIPCDGRFYEPVYRSDLFYATPEICPQLSLGRDKAVDYATIRCPVSERAAYDESVWLPQFLLIGEDSDIEDIASAVRKVMRNMDELSRADPALAGLKAVSRAERPKKERARNY